MNIKTEASKAIVSFFQNALAFETIYQNPEANYVLHNSSLGQHFFLHIIHDKTFHKPLSNEHLIVFYLNDQTLYQQLCDQLIQYGAQQEVAFNPYWNEKGRSFCIEDVHIILCPTSYQHYRVRIAAPTIDLNKLDNELQVLGLHSFGSFNNHHQFDGVMLKSQIDIDCHLEFTYFHETKDLIPSDKISLSLITAEPQSNLIKQLKIDNHVFESHFMHEKIEWLQACVNTLFNKSTQVISHDR
ncbi:MAG: hypothetical protein SFW66_10085 [Gammaproteobacteria bacterium]|nr:hypothetical protein [Gammaproteobacteria bacterium]